LPTGTGKLVALVVPDDFPVESLAIGTTHARGLVPTTLPTNYLMNVVQQVSRALNKRTGADDKQSRWALGITEYQIVQ